MFLKQRWMSYNSSKDLVVNLDDHVFTAPSSGFPAPSTLGCLRLMPPLPLGLPEQMATSTVPWIKPHRLSGLSRWVLVSLVLSQGPPLRLVFVLQCRDSVLKYLVQLHAPLPMNPWGGRGASHAQQPPSLRASPEQLLPADAWLLPQTLNFTNLPHFSFLLFSMENLEHIQQ